jgi:hypothetical protein
MSPKEKARPKPGFDGGVPNHSELELRCGVPHRLGGAAEVGGVRLVDSGLGQATWLGSLAR